MKFKLVVEEGKRQILARELNFYELQEYASSLDDTVENNDIFKILAKHPSQDVREKIASKDNLSKEVCKIFDHETSMYVIRSFVRTDGCRKFISQKQLITWVAKDVEVASAIANNVERFENISTDSVVKILMNYQDPSVVAELASNSSLNKKYLKELLKHSDTKISSNARYSLS